MKAIQIGWMFCFWVLDLSAQDHLVRNTEALSPEAELAALTVPEGFEIGLFAAEPMINKPINLAVDERGRVWVSSTVEYPYAAAKERWVDPQGSSVRDSRDAIKILEDTDGDGRADKVIDFVDGLNIPTGVLPWHRPEHADGCIAWSIPNLWYFADTDGDEKADHREVLFGPLGYEKDTHGMVSSLRLGADGWVYATHGFNNTSHLRAKDGNELELHSGNVFRFRPDGSQVEIWSRGQVNPFGLCFDSRGNLYSADCHSSPVYQLLQGAVYPSFGKAHDGLGFGPAMIEHTHGSTGIAGIIFIDRGVWGEEWDDHVLIGNPVTSRVNLDHVVFSGTTPRAEEKADFVVSEDPWFRPVDITLTPDGTVYIADFYNRIIGHYEVPLDHPGRDRERGRIWRVNKHAPRPKPKADTFTQTSKSVDPVADLAATDAWVKRKAAEALIDQPLTEAIPALLRAFDETPEADTHLRHVLRIALKHCLSLPGAYPRLGGDGVSNKGSIIASVSLAVPTPEAAAWLFNYRGSENLPTDFSDLRRRHMAKFGDPETLSKLLAEQVNEGANSTLLEQAQALVEIAETLEERQGVLRDPTLLSEMTRVVTALLRPEGDQSEPTWKTTDGTWEVQPRQTNEGATIEVISSLVRKAKNAEAKTGTISSRSFVMPARIAFRLCGHLGPPGKAAHGKNFIRLLAIDNGEELARALPPRNDAAAFVEWQLPIAVGREVRLEIVDGDDGTAYAWLALGAVEGVDLPVADFVKATTEHALLRRYARLLVTSAPVDLRDRLKPYLPAPPPAPPLEITKSERARLDTLIAERVASYNPGQVDPVRGKTIFATHCAVCHRLAGEGGLIGPQLDGIDTRGLARLAEDILDPNRNVDSHFRLTSLVKTDGTVIAGFIVGEADEIVHLLGTDGQDHRVLRSDIAKREVSSHSLMPAAFDELLNPDEFHDLVGWLLKGR